MIGKLRLLEFGLLAIIALLGWQMRRELHEARAREQALLSARLKPAAVPGLAPLPKFTPITAIQYAEAAAKNLFSKDRNPNVILDPTPPPKEKPVPPFPSARGVMLWPGFPPTVVLSEKPGGTQKGYHPGDTIGDWKIVSVDPQYVDFEWDGKQFKKRIDELLDKTTIANEVAANAPASAPAPTPTSGSLGSASGSNGSGSSSSSGSQFSNPAPAPGTPGPGIDLGGGYRACTTGDPTPSGAVVGGMRKVSAATPFGTSCRWEPAK